MNKCVVVAAVLWCAAGSAPWAVPGEREQDLLAIENTGISSAIENCKQNRVQGGP